MYDFAPSEFFYYSNSRFFSATQIRVFNLCCELNSAFLYLTLFDSTCITCDSVCDLITLPLLVSGGARGRCRLPAPPGVPHLWAAGAPGARLPHQGAKVPLLFLLFESPVIEFRQSRSFLHNLAAYRVSWIAIRAFATQNNLTNLTTDIQPRFLPVCETLVLFSNHRVIDQSNIAPFLSKTDGMRFNQLFDICQPEFPHVVWPDLFY